jgi:hypothetical protein
MAKKVTYRILYLITGNISVRFFLSAKKAKRYLESIGFSLVKNSDGIYFNRRMGRLAKIFREPPLKKGA